MRLAVIPARGGSKRIPRKNIKPFAGKPMIAWSIETALLSGCFDEVIVSTDDPEIADVARQCRATVPFMRPAALADDHTGTIPVVRHAVQWFEQDGRRPSQVCCIYATAPFIQVADIRRGLDLLQANDCSYAFAVTSYPFPIQRAIRINVEGRVEMLYPEHFHTRSQDLEEAWHDAGQFYWGQAQAWLEERVVFAKASVPVPLPRYRVQDIDTPEDWIRAEWMFSAMRNEGTLA
jgi:N-acylneuraminate cytidylyltransferase